MMQQDVLFVVFYKVKKAVLEQNAFKIVHI